MEKLRCAVCKGDVPGTKGHRDCLLELFKENKIQTSADWMEMNKCYSQPKKWVTIKVKKEHSN